jgi:D-serine deaminase-like pyridoxal phosphate-dependent protein
MKNSVYRTLPRETGGIVDYLDTPSLIVYLDKLERNIEGMAARAKRAGVKLRPHIKTHKSPLVASMQIAAGASGITVAKLGEAEIMRQHGITDILVAYPLVGPAKLKRLERLATGTDIIVSLDSAEVAQGICAVGERLGKKMPIYIEVNTGLHRVGTDSTRRTVVSPGSVPTRCNPVFTSM